MIEITEMLQTEGKEEWQEGQFVLLTLFLDNKIDSKILFEIILILKLDSTRKYIKGLKEKNT